ncbi:MAG TPA: hypothetical protein DDX19_18555 [Rhodopirellula baltica]|nr:ankyrin repeat domain-containing protein [Rhodopirellula baltica]HBE64708.1 hypothetical protein [Rhodopirellula baltica]
MLFPKKFLKTLIPVVLPVAFAAAALQPTLAISAPISAKANASTIGSEQAVPSPSLHERLCDVNPNWVSILGSETFDLDGESEVGEVQLLQKHFELMIERLENAKVDDLNASQTKQRRANIQRLREYAVDGVFPQNIFVAGRRPVFIDPWGTHCAVGHLIATSGYPGLARRINEEHRLDELGAITTDGLREWQLASGLRIEELALIQPHYQFRMNSQTIKYPSEIEALILGDSSTVLEALEKGELKVDSRCGGKTLLHIAAAAGDLKLVKRLVEMGADLNAVSTLGCDEDETGKGGKHSRFEVRLDGSTQVTKGDRYAGKGRVYQTVRGAFVADVLQDFYGGLAGKNALEFATAEPRPSKYGAPMYAYYGKRMPFGGVGNGSNPLEEVKTKRTEVAKWLREQGLK